MYKQLIKSAVVLFVLACLLGCSSSAFKVSVKSDAGINRDTQARALPVELRVYQLSDESNFKRATFRELWKQDASVLGSQMLSRDDQLVSPNSRIKLKVTRKPEAQYIGVMAVFRNPDNDGWRVIKTIPRGVKYIPGTVSVVLHNNSIELVS